MVTQAGAINTAMIGHQISPLSQQIIAVSVVCSGGGKRKKIYFIAQKRATRPQSRASWFSGLRGRSGQTCNFWNSHPAAYFFLCQLLAAGSGCGPLDLTIVACGPRLASACVKCSSQKNNKSAVGKYIVSVVIWTAGKHRWRRIAGGAGRQENAAQDSISSFFWFYNIPSLFTLWPTSSSLFSRMSWTMAFLCVFTCWKREKRNHTINKRPMSLLWLFSGTHPTRPPPASQPHKQSHLFQDPAPAAMLASE